MARRSDAQMIRETASSITEAASKIAPAAKDLDEIFGTQLRSALKDLRAIDGDLWGVVDILETDGIIEKSA